MIPRAPNWPVPPTQGQPAGSNEAAGGRGDYPTGVTIGLIVAAVLLPAIITVALAITLEASAR